MEQFGLVKFRKQNILNSTQIGYFRESGEIHQ